VVGEYRTAAGVSITGSPLIILVDRRAGRIRASEYRAGGADPEGHLAWFHDSFQRSPGK
jgi:hypothetical protein